jgi:hypothetical protein
MKKSILLAGIIAVGAVALGMRLLGAAATGPSPTVIIHSSPVYTAAAVGSLNSMRLLAPPTMDGQLSDWPAGESIELNRNTAYTFRGTIDSLNDLSAVIRSGWDDRHLYFAIQVTDDVVIGGDSADVWRDDSVELGFDGLNDEYPWGWDDHQYNIVVDGRLTDRLVPISDIGVAISQHQGGYDIEVSIPVERLLAGIPISGTVAGFTVGIHDDDDRGNYDAYLIWQGTNTSSSPEQFGDLIFTERPEDRLIALESQLVKLERKLQELLVILKEFEPVVPPE